MNARIEWDIKRYAHIMIRNIAFSSIIKIDGRQFEFNFRKQPSRNAFEADVTDRSHQRLAFIMEKSPDNSWVANAAFLPDWIATNANLIGRHIDNYLAELTPV